MPPLSLHQSVDKMASAEPPLFAHTHINHKPILQTVSLPDVGKYRLNMFIVHCHRIPLKK